MKILLLANSDWFLHRFCSELAAALRAAGCDLVLASPPGEYARRLQVAGFGWRPVRIARRRLRPLAELRTLAGLRALLGAERPDLVHFFTLKAALYGTLAVRLSAAGRRTAIVSSITGLGYLWSTPGWRVRLLRRTAELAARWLLPRTRLIFLNRDDFDEFRRRGLAAAERSHLIPGSGVDCERFRPSPGEDPAAVPVVAFVGRLLRSKGAGDFVAAARRLRERGVEARFVLVGESDAGNPDAVPAGEIEGWRKQGFVEVWGFRDDVADVYRRSSIVCLPTVYREGVPTVLLEAAACGKPVVATDMPGCREAVADGDSGLLVPPGDVAALSEALAKLLADPSLRLRMGESGRRRAIERFDVRKVVAATLEVYRRAGVEIPSGDGGV
jgi:glycosyltransferase involved in cell wall biosynthesis